MAALKSYAAAAAAVATTTNTTNTTLPTVLEAPKPTAKQRKLALEKKRLVVVTNSTSKPVLDAKEQRDVINATLSSVASNIPVVASVSISVKNNLVLTTTPNFSADFLLQHQDKWQKALSIEHTRIQKQEKWA